MNKKPFLLMMLSASILYTNPYSVIADSSVDLSKKIEQKNQSKIQTQSQIQSISEEKRQVEQDLASIDQQLNETAEELNRANKLIQQQESYILNSKKHSKKIEERIEKREDILSKRIQIMYEVQQENILLFLFSSTDVKNFLERWIYIQTLIEGDLDILESQQEDKKDLLDEQTLMSKRMSRLAELKSEVERTKQIFDTQKKAREDILSKVLKNEDALVDVLEEQQNEIEELIRKYNIAKYNEQHPQSNGTSSASLHTGNAIGDTTGVIITGNATTQNWVWPVQGGGRFSSPFGYRVHPILHTRKFHSGIDLAAPEGTDIYAVEGGEVILAGYTNGYGNTVMIEHPDGMVTLYGHIRHGGIVVSEGQSVSAGQKIAEVGSTGRSTGPHLHFEVRMNGKAENSKIYLDQRTIIRK